MPPFEPGIKAPRGALQVTPSGKPITWRKDYILDIGGYSYPITTATYKAFSVKSQWVIGDQQNKKACCPLLCPSCSVRRQFGTIENPGNYNYSFVNSSWCACTPRLMNLNLSGISGPPYFGYWYATKQYSYDSTFSPNGQKCLRYSYYNTKYATLNYSGEYPCVTTTTNLFNGQTVKSNSFANLNVSIFLDCSQIDLSGDGSSSQSSRSLQSFSSASSKSSASSNSSSSSKSSHHPHNASGTSSSSSNSSSSNSSSSSSSSWSSASSPSSESSDAREEMVTARVCAQICVSDGAGSAFGSWSMCGSDNDGYDEDDPDKYWVVGETPVPIDFARAWQNLFNGKNWALSRNIKYDTFYLLTGFCDRKFNWSGSQSNNLKECYSWTPSGSSVPITVCHTNGSGGSASISFAGPDECPDCQYNDNEYFAKVACYIEWVMDSYDNGVTWQYKRAYLQQAELNDYPNPPKAMGSIFQESSEDLPPLWEWDVWQKQASAGYCRAYRYQLLGHATLNAWCDGIKDAIDNPPPDFTGDGKPCFSDQDVSSASSNHSSQSTASSSSSSSSKSSQSNSDVDESSIETWGPGQTSHTSDGPQSSGQEPSSSSSHGRSSWSSVSYGTLASENSLPSSADPSSQSTGSPSSYSSASSQSSSSSSTHVGGGVDNNSSSSSSQSGECNCYGIPYNFAQGSESSEPTHVTINSSSVGCASALWLRGGPKTQHKDHPSHTILPLRRNGRYKQKKCHRLYIYEGVHHNGSRYVLEGVTPRVVRTEGRKTYNAYSGPFHAARRYDEPSPGDLLTDRPFWFSECGIGGWSEITEDNWFTPTTTEMGYIYQYAAGCSTGLPAAGVSHTVILYVRMTRTHESLSDSSVKLLAVHGTCSGGGVITPVGSESKSSNSSSSNSSSSTGYEDTHGLACNDCSHCPTNLQVAWGASGHEGGDSTIHRFGGSGSCYWLGTRQSDLVNPTVRQIYVKCYASYWVLRVDFLDGTYYEYRTDVPFTCPPDGGWIGYANTRDNGSLSAIVGPA